MKTSIYINQKKLIELAPEATLKEAAILEYLYYFCNSKSEKVEYHRIEYKGMKYTWISSAYLLDEMPLLKGRTPASLTPVFKKLREWGFVDTYIEPGKGRQYYALLPKTYNLFRKKKPI